MELSDMRVAILGNNEFDSTQRWVISCRKREIQNDIIDLTKEDWFESATKYDYSLYLTRPPCKISKFIPLYLERVRILNAYLGKVFFPDIQEIEIYENKRYLSFFLTAHKIPSPRTWVFYYKEEAFEFVKRKENFPLVGKTNNGAAGSGVVFLKNKNSAEEYVLNAFSRKGIRRRFGPNRMTGSSKKWLLKAITAPSYARMKIKEYFEISDDSQRGFVIFQEFIPHHFEWRVVKIGDSYFAHKKACVGLMASGTKEKIYDNPPVELFDFVKSLCEKHKFNTMAVDLFESDRGFLVNEMQTIFGQSDAYQMLVDGKIGRYRYINQKWVFEEGDFNTNESYDLRLEVALKMFAEHKMKQ